MFILLKDSGNDFSQTSQDMKQQKGQQQQPMDGISTKVPESSHKQQKSKITLNLCYKMLT